MYVKLYVCVVTLPQGSTADTLCVKMCAVNLVICFQFGLRDVYMVIVCVCVCIFEHLQLQPGWRLCSGLINKCASESLFTVRGVSWGPIADEVP